MKIKVLGAHNSESRNTHYMSLLVDDILALDAGSLTSTLSFRAQMKIQAVLLTHAHYDHMRDIPALGMNLFLRRKSVNIYTHQSAYDKVMRYFLDGEIYPLFQSKPAESPTLRFHLLSAFDETSIEGYRVLPVPVPHSLPAMGYQITSPDGQSVFYSGDTGLELAETWKRISPQVIFIELTAPNRWEDSVKHNGHMTPNLLKQALINFKNLKGYLPRIIGVHMNPEGENEIKAELAELEEKEKISVTLAREGMTVII